MDNPVAHLVFVRGVDAVFAEILKRTVEAIKAFLALAALNGSVVHEVAEFDVRIERTRRLPPSERNVATEICAESYS